MPKLIRLAGLALLALLAVTASAQAQQPTGPTPDTAAKVAAIADKVLHDTGVPSASVAIVQNGQVVYAHAFGLAHVSPPKTAEASMAYPIGSISKQFTASAILLLQQQGKLSVDDPIAKYFPDLTRAKDITIRNLLTMTSGYEDYAPQDYIIPAWLQTADPYTVVHEWATKPLDFEPGTEYQYSNTNFVLAALIVQKVSGAPFAQFLREHVLAPAGVENAFNTYADRSRLQVTGYVSVALQPVREQPLEATGWYFGDGDLAMPASSLATWDICVIRQCLLQPASYKQMETPFRFTGGPNAGKDSQYGFALDIRNFNGVHALEHSGEVGGFVAENIVFPDQNAAIVVLTNEVASSAASKITVQLAPLVLGDVGVKAFAKKPSNPFDELRTILTGLAQGQIDRSLFTPDDNSYFDAAALADFKAELSPLGAIISVTSVRTDQRGGMTFDLYHVGFANGTILIVDDYQQPSGKIEQFLITGKL